ncbi:MAG: hypothetical protein PHV13_02145 [Candidatus ainarchaeum sp.]|nr:hypothetical protein [Candidatus ainarchaeum sp.]
MARKQVYGDRIASFRLSDRQCKNFLVLRGDNTTRLFDAHPMVERFNKKHETKLTVMSHTVANELLDIRSTAWKQLPPFAVDGFIAYEKPGTKFGSEIVFKSPGSQDIVFATGTYKNEKDIAIVAFGLSSANFVKGGKSIYLDILENKLIPITEFPGKSGWGIPYGGTTVPCGDEALAYEHPSSRYLNRDEGAYVGLLVRNIKAYGDTLANHGIFAYLTTRHVLGVLAEVPDADVGKVKDLIRAQKH